MAADRAAGAARTVFRVWPDYTLYPHLDRSVSTIKSDAAVRSYAATGEGVTWAVLDSGIDQHHPHFAGGTLTGAVAKLHHDFTYLLTPTRNRRRTRTQHCWIPKGTARTWAASSPAPSPPGRTGHRQPAALAGRAARRLGDPAARRRPDAHPGSRPRQSW